MMERIEDTIDMLDRHVQVLQLVIAHEPIGITRLSEVSGYPQHKIRYSLRLLEAENLIDPTSVGATTTAQTSAFVAGLNEDITAVAETLDTLPIDDVDERQITDENDEPTPALPDQ